MKRGYLSQYFVGVAAKTLSAVEIDESKSNQHELNGVSSLKKIFGTEKQTFKTDFMYLNDSDDEPVVDIGFLTWYNAREAHPTRTEFRMYFPTTTVSSCASEGDELFIGLRPDKSILWVITEKDSTISNQLNWLFGIESDNKFEVRDNLDKERDKIAFTSRLILENLNIEIDYSEEQYLADMLHRFNGTFPTTRIFSEYARTGIDEISNKDNPDIVLLKWVEREEVLFKTLEKHIILQRLDKGFTDVDDFIQYSLSVQNRRKSRAGASLENHVEQILLCNDVSYDREKVTENKSKPDFVFPNIKSYHDNDFETSLLTMLGVKSTCKDRWRQVLSEASRIKNKHLLTLEAAISLNQTIEMQSNNLQLVVPKAIKNTYSQTQQEWVIDVNDFIEHVKFNQRSRSW